MGLRWLWRWCPCEACALRREPRSVTLSVINVTDPSLMAAALASGFVDEAILRAINNRKRP